MSHPPNNNTNKIGTSTSVSPRTVVVSPGTVAASSSSSFEPAKASHSSTRQHCNEETPAVLSFSKAPPPTLTELTTLETTSQVEAMRTCRTLQDELFQTQQDLWEGMMREVYQARYHKQQTLQQVSILQKALQESDLALKHTTRQLELRTDQVQVLSKYIHNEMNKETKKKEQVASTNTAVTAANENDRSSYLASSLLDGILPTSFSKQPPSTPDHQTKNIMNMK